MQRSTTALAPGVAGISLSCVAVPVLADGTDTGFAMNPAFGAGDLASFAVSMLIVVALIVGLGWLYSRLRFTGNNKDRVISIVASRALGQKERLLLVQVADRQLLVGMTASQVQTLYVFDEPVAGGDVRSESTGFRHRLRAAVLEGAK